MSGSRRISWLLLPLFFGSGFAALLYQMVWQRLLTLFGGADVYSVTIIVASFMAGLGFGSLAGGHVADRLGLRGRFLAFAGAELAIALFALVSVPLLHDVLYAPPRSPRPRRGHHRGDPPPGASLADVLHGDVAPAPAPRPSRMRERPPEEWIGALYGVNTLGRRGGLPRHRMGAGAARGLRALGADRSPDQPRLRRRGLRPRRGASRADPARPDANDRRPAMPVAPSTFSFPTWTAVYALSGFVALSLEILWFRILGVVLKSNSFTFADAPRDLPHGPRRRRPPRQPLGPPGRQPGREVLDPPIGDHPLRGPLHDAPHPRPGADQRLGPALALPGGLRGPRHRRRPPRHLPLHRPRRKGRRASSRTRRSCS